MGNLFRGWPPHALAQLHSEQRLERDYSVCTHYRLVSRAFVPRPVWRPRHLLALGNQIVDFVAGRRETLWYWARLDHMLQWCRQFAPQVIYTRPLETPGLYWWLPRYLARRLGIPYVTHVMDDWPARYEGKRGLNRRLVWKPLLRRNLSALFGEAAINLGISPEMCTAYRRKYGSPFVPFHNCIEVAEWLPWPREQRTDGVFQLVYIGAVAQDKDFFSLREMCDVVLALARQGSKIRFVLYAPATCADLICTRLVCPPDVVYGGYTPPCTLPRLLGTADLLVLPINFDTVSQRYVGYSFQTKVPEYMASGTPTLVYGPATNPNVRYARRHAWGYVVDRPERHRLTQAVLELMRNSTLRTRLGQRARTLAFEHHDAAVVRQRFRRLLCDVAAGRLVAGQEWGS